MTTEDTKGLRRTTVWVDPAQMEAAKVEAERRGESVGAAVRRFLKGYTRNAGKGDQ